MSSLGRREFSLGLASLAACGRIAEESVAPISPSPDAGPPAPGFIPTPAPCSTPASFPSFTLEGVSNLTPARRTLYTWTTPSQVENLYDERILYTKRTNDAGYPGWLFDYLESDWNPHSALKDPTYRLGRFAWVYPWASALSAEDYGPELVRIDLVDDALFVIVESNEDYEGAFRAVDMNNAPVDLTTALATPERIAGIFFCNGMSGDVHCGFSTVYGTREYREFHLCHENLVAEWSVHTEENLALIEDGLALLSRVRDGLTCADYQIPCAEVLEQWSRSPSTDYERFVACLAFGFGASYDPLASWLEMGIRRLEKARSLFGGAPLVHRPNG